MAVERGGFHVSIDRIVVDGGSAAAPAELTRALAEQLARQLVQSSDVVSEVTRAGGSEHSLARVDCGTDLAASPGDPAAIGRRIASSIIEGLSR